MSLPVMLHNNILCVLYFCKLEHHGKLKIAIIKTYWFIGVALSVCGYNSPLMLNLRELSLQQ